MQETILIVYLVVAIALVGIILIQQGKGAEMGASFGAGGANTVFGAAGSGNALTKTTTILAILFFAIALSISYLNSTPEVVVDEVFDEAPAVEKTNIEAELPAENTPATGGIETALPTSVEAANEATKVDAAEKTDKAAEKVEDASKTTKEDDTDASKTDAAKKEGDNQ